MIRRYLILTALLAVMYGCANPVKSTLSPRYNDSRPYTIAIAPVAWEGQSDGEDKEIARLFRTMTGEKLNAMNYRVVAPEDPEIKKPDSQAKDVAGLSRQLAADLDSDAVLYIHITGWDKDRMVTYAALAVKARFEIYSSGGEPLWRAEYSTKESDLRLDKKPLEMAVIKIYEPRVQRFVDAVFSTLPQGGVPKRAQKTFFQWLP